MPFDYRPFPYVPPPGLTAPEPRHPVVIAGAGPIGLAAHAAFARPHVNSCRLSRPCIYPLTGPDDPALPAPSCPGAVAPDAPTGDGWLIDALGHTPVLLALGQPAPDIGIPALTPALNDTLRARYLGTAAAALYLVRPDQVIHARWTSTDAETLRSCLAALWEGAPCP